MIWEMLLTALFDELGNEASPAGLMACSNSRAIVPVKILIEKDEIAPVRIALKKLVRACHGPAAVRITQENVDEPPGNFGGDLPEIRFGAGTRRALHFKILAVVVVIFLERFHQQIVDGKPDRTAPVGIPTEEASRGFAGS